MCSVGRRLKKTSLPTLCTADHLGVSVCARQKMNVFVQVGEVNRAADFEDPHSALSASWTPVAEYNMLRQESPKC